MSTSERGGGGLSPKEGLPNPLPVPTSSGGHCSGQYASCWNAFSFTHRFLFGFFSVINSDILFQKDTREAHNI